jgi:uncharacterized repeat protein (TIGR03806 family)
MIRRFHPAVPSVPRLAFAVSFVVCAVSAIAQNALPRVPATSLRMPAEGNTFAYKSVPAFGGIAFDQPVQVVYAPGETRRAFVAERWGQIAVVRDTTAPTREVFLDLSPRIRGSTADLALLSVAFHPRFAENGFFYVWFSTYVNGQRVNRLSRYRAPNGSSGVADPASESPLITQATGFNGHDGGTILFGADGYLYLSLGDGDRNIPEIDAAHQRIDRGFFGGVIRIDVDQRPGNLPPNAHPSVHPGTYSIPADNPFVGLTSFNGSALNPAAVRTEWWAVGLRNPFRMAFDAADGRLWVGDVGLSTREEIDLITRGGNYGWEYREGLTAGPKTEPAPAGAQFIDPIWDYGQSQGYSITGGFVYHGTRHADLVGDYLFADFVSGKVWALVDDGGRPLGASQVRQIASEGGITGMTMDPSTGEVLLADFDGNLIKRLVPNPNANGTSLPPTLADTGVFANAVTLTPAPGVLPYTPNVSFWSDFAAKSRWFALPDTTSRFGFKENGPWSLPAGAVWVKHFDLELRRGVPTTARRVETRVLVKTTDALYGASYRWNDEQTNATLVPENGALQSFTVTLPNGMQTLQTWSFPSRDDCLACHTEKGGGALSFNTRQLNRAGTNDSTNQLTELAARGYLDASLPLNTAALPALANPHDPTVPVETRARAYLDVNCSQCHQPGGTGTGTFDARASTPLSLAGIVNAAPTATAGTALDRILVPGDTAHSVLLQRLAGNGVGRMPPLGAVQRDEAGETLIAEWITDLARPRPASRLLNLAARAQVGSGADILIPGFFVGGTTSKNILVRAVGPGLAAFGVGGTLGSTVLTLFNDKQQPIASNTRWNSGSNPAELRSVAQRVGAFALSEDSADSALLITLPPGAYTAQTAGANNATGVALVEIYDADAVASAGANAPRLINTAVRAQVGTGANVLIPGLVVSEGAAKTVLIRAVGPGIAGAPFNVTGTVTQPVVTLFAGSEAFLTNAGWANGANAAEIRATAARVGAFPLPEGSRDSALLVSLSPGSYTVQVSGANNTSGVALVEVYEVP